MTLHDYLVRAERNGHVNPSEFPFHPCPSVQPCVAVFEPWLVIELAQSLHYSLRTYAVGAVRVCKVACHINLVGLNFLEKLLYDIYVLLCPLAFLDSSCLVERKVKEVGVGAVI